MNLISGAAAVAFLVSTLPAFAQTARELTPEQRATWNAPSEPFRIIDNIYYVGTAGLASYLVTSPGGHVLVNAALPEAIPQIKANIDRLGFRLADIKYLLATHAHADHTFGLAEMQKATGAQMVTSAGDKQVLEGQETSAWADNPAELSPVRVDRVIGPGDKVMIGKLSLLAWMTPGHSPGCTTWTTVAREKKWNQTAVFYCSPAAAVNALTDDYPERAADYKKTYETSRGIIASIFLPPHPEMFGMEEKRPLIGQYGVNPFVKSGEFHSFVREAEKPYLDPPAPKPKKKRWRSRTTVGEGK